MNFFIWNVVVRNHIFHLSKGSTLFVLKASLLCVVTPSKPIQTKTHSRLNSSVMCVYHIITQCSTLVMWVPKIYLLDARENSNLNKAPNIPLLYFKGPKYNSLCNIDCGRRQRLRQSWWMCFIWQSTWIVMMFTCGWLVSLNNFDKFEG